MKLFALAVVLCFATSCATKRDDTAQGSSVATCYVCRYNNDLACIRVRVNGSTPRAEYQGTTYYFCSDDCREAFLRNPRKYLPKE